MEMMVAVTILALLTTVTGMTVLNLVKRARTQQTGVIMDDVLSALIAYRDEMGRWPRDANVCLSINSGTQPNYVINGFDNGRRSRRAPSSSSRPIRSSSSSSTTPRAN